MARSKAIDVLNLFSSIFMIILLLVVLTFALLFGSQNLSLLTGEFQVRMYNLAILIAVVTSISQWIEGRAKSITKSIDNLRSKKEAKTYG